MQTVRVMETGTVVTWSLAITQDWVLEQLVVALIALALLVHWLSVRLVKIKKS